MSTPRIRFTVQATTTLESLWYDEQWHRELLADGLSETEALREMVRTGFEEDGISILWEMFGPPPETAKYFAQAISEIGLVESARRGPDCNCSEYGHGLNLTRVISRSCPVHSKAENSHPHTRETT